MKKAIFLLSGLFFVLQTFAVTVVAQGSGITRERALKQALRNAIEQAVGVQIFSQTVVENMQLSKDILETYSKGAIENYQILKEEKREGFYTLWVRASVSDKVVESFFKNPAVQHFFQKLCFHKRRIGVLYVRRTNNDLPFNSVPARVLINLLQDRLTQYQFRVFISYLSPQEVQNLEDGELAREIARKENLDAVVLARITVLKQPLGYYQKLTVGVSLKAFDVNSGEFFASAYKEVTKLFMRDPGTSYIDKLVIELGKQKALALMGKVVDRFQTKGCTTTYTIVLRNVNPAIIDTFEGIMDDLELDYRIIKATPTYAEYEVLSDLDLRGLKRLLRKGLRREHLRIYPVRIENQKIVFEPYTF